MKPEDKEQYLKRYAELKKKGHAFYPYSIFKDVAISAAILLLLIALTVAFGSGLEAKADPTNTSYIPRPEWYFMFLFEALKFFPGQIEWVGVVVVPGITLLALALYPFLDRSPERRPTRRPFSTVIACLVVIFTVWLTVKAFQGTPSTSAADLTPIQQSGRQLYQSNGCASCHAISGVGGKVGPDLAGIGERSNAAAIERYIEDPKSVNPNATMPGFVPPLTPQQAEHITQYLLTIKR